MLSIINQWKTFLQPIQDRPRHHRAHNSTDFGVKWTQISIYFRPFTWVITAVTASMRPLIGGETPVNPHLFAGHFYRDNPERFPPLQPAPTRPQPRVPQPRLPSAGWLAVQRPSRGCRPWQLWLGHIVTHTDQAWCKPVANEPRKKPLLLSIILVG